MVAKSGHSPTQRSPSQIELSEHFSHQEVFEGTPSSSDDLEQDTGLSTSSSKDQQQQESITLIDVVANDFEHIKPGFSFRELARFFGPGLLTCVAYVVSILSEFQVAQVDTSEDELQPHLFMSLQDPGNLEADLQAGGSAGYALLWLFLVCTIMVKILAKLKDMAPMCMHIHIYLYLQFAA